MLLAVFWAVAMKVSNAFFACSTLCSANVRISCGISKFPVASLAIFSSPPGDTVPSQSPDLEDCTRRDLLAFKIKHRERRKLHSRQRILLCAAQQEGMGLRLFLTLAQHGLAGCTRIIKPSFTVEPRGALRRVSKHGR